MPIFVVFAKLIMKEKGLFRLLEINPFKLLALKLITSSNGKN